MQCGRSVVPVQNQLWRDLLKFCCHLHLLEECCTQVIQFVGRTQVLVPPFLFTNSIQHSRLGLCCPTDHCSINFADDAISSCNSNRGGHSSTILSQDLDVWLHIGVNCVTEQQWAATFLGWEPCHWHFIQAVTWWPLFPELLVVVFLIERLVLLFSGLSNSLENLRAAAAFPFSLAYLPICTHCLSVSQLYSPRPASSCWHLVSRPTRHLRRFTWWIVGGRISVSGLVGSGRWPLTGLKKCSSAIVPRQQGERPEPADLGFTCDWDWYAKISKICLTQKYMHLWYFTTLYNITSHHPHDIIPQTLEYTVNIAFSPVFYQFQLMKAYTVEQSCCIVLVLHSVVQRHYSI